MTESALKRIEALKTDDMSTELVMPTDGHPNDLLFAPDGRLFVSCGSGNSVLSLNPKTGQQKERISVTLTPRSPAGTTPNSLSLSPDGKTLYVADADNNDVAVIDVAQSGRSRVRGFIPTGWYPTLVCATPDGKNLLVGAGKGMGVGPNGKPNPATTDPVERHYTYIGTLRNDRHLACAGRCEAGRLFTAGDGELALSRFASQRAVSCAEVREQSYSLSCRRCVAHQIYPLYHQGESDIRSGAG